MPRFEAQINTAAAEDRILVILQNIPTELRKTVGDIAGDAVLVYVAHAPRGASGRLGRGIRAIRTQSRGAGGRFGSGFQYTVVASAKDYRGFDYVGVSRFGHRLKIITPRHDRAEASVIATRKGRAPAGGIKPALRIPSRTGGKPLYRHEVRGIVRATDWAEEARFVMNRELNARAKELGTKLERKFFL